jgi:hypothetical protein
MAHIEISNLSAAGSDLFTGTDSFLTELQTTDTNQIFGGYNYHHCGKQKHHKGWKGSHSSYSYSKKVSKKVSKKPYVASYCYYKKPC